MPETKTPVAETTKAKAKAKPRTAALPKALEETAQTNPQIEAWYICDRTGEWFPDATRAEKNFESYKKVKNPFYKKPE